LLALLRASDIRLSRGKRGFESPRAPEKINLKAIHLLLAHDEVCANE